MKKLYNPSLAVLFAVLLYCGYAAIGGILGSWMAGAWMSGWGSWSFMPFVLMALAVSCSAGLLVGFPFGALVSQKPIHWAVPVSAAVVAYITAQYYPVLVWAHYFEYASLTVAFVCFSWLGFVTAQHLTRR